MEKAFATATEFDRALKRAVRESGGDPGAGYRQALRDRFLCRVFRGGNRDFVLKGGSGMLARIPDARATRDVDLGLLVPMNFADVVDELVRLASSDLGDFCRFELAKTEERVDENGYSRLLKLRFASYVGAEEKDPVLIDLSLGCEPVGEIVSTEPTNRIKVPGVETSPYMLYPIADQLADKLCAIMELQPGGYPSSRMKDLVDVVLIARTQSVSAAVLSLAIVTECSRRGMALPSRFAAPDFWESDFGRFVKSNGLDVPFVVACDLAARLFDPVLEGVVGGEWIPEEALWA